MPDLFVACHMEERMCVIQFIDLRACLLCSVTGVVAAAP